MQNSEPASIEDGYPSLHFEVPPNLDELWENLLVDTLPPDKRDSVQAQWDQTPDENDRYMMFLE